MAKKTNLNQTFNMRFADIKVSKFIQKNLKINFNLQASPIIEFISNFTFGVNEDKNHVVCSLNIELLILETKELFAEITIDNTFEVTPLEKVSKFIKEDNEFQLADNLIYTLIEISSSTARGILHEKFKGTIAQLDTYPLIDPKTLTRNEK